MKAAEKLRELAAWYREFAERAGSSAIWDSRLRTAEDLEAEAKYIEQRRHPEHLPEVLATARSAPGEALDLEGGEKVLEVGTGSGYCSGGFGRDCGGSLHD